MEADMDMATRIVGGLWGGAEVVSTCTRAQAIDDGTLVDVSSVAREAGITYPVALTRAVWSECVDASALPAALGQDESGRLWDVLWMLRCAIMARRGVDRLAYTLLVRRADGRLRRVRLVSVCGPGDDAEPVITVMRPDES
jgi:hypothetical protein